MRQYPDLHLHSTASDGSCSPTELVELAARAGVTTLALTDHDTTAGLDEAARACAAHGIEFIPGCELSSTTEYGHVDFLGLWAPRHDPAFEARLAGLRNARGRRNQRILDKLDQLGIKIDLSGYVADHASAFPTPGAAACEAEKSTGGGCATNAPAGGEASANGAADEAASTADPSGHPGDLSDHGIQGIQGEISGSNGRSPAPHPLNALGRPHIAMELCRLGYVKSVQEAFNRYIGLGKPAYSAKDPFSPEEAVGLLSSFGAVTVLAHPMLVRAPEEWLEGLAVRLKPHGLDALEAYHSEHSNTGIRRILRLAEKHGLLVSGGSDFHGRSKPSIKIGCGKGSLRVPETVLEPLRRRHQEKTAG